MIFALKSVNDSDGQFRFGENWVFVQIGLFRAAEREDGPKARGDYFPSPQSRIIDEDLFETKERGIYE